MSGAGDVTGYRQAAPPDQQVQPTLWLGPLRLNLSTRDVTVGGQPLILTRKEYSLLELLMRRRGNVLEKQALIEHLYGDTSDSKSKMIDIFVCKLRKKLAAAGLPSVIGTAWGKGYILCDPAPQHNSGPHATG